MGRCDNTTSARRADQGPPGLAATGRLPLARTARPGDTELAGELLVELRAIVLGDRDHPDDARFERADHSPPAIQVLAAIRRPGAVSGQQTVAGGTATLGYQFGFQPTPVCGRPAAKIADRSICGACQPQPMGSHGLESALDEFAALKLVATLNEPGLPLQIAIM